MKTFSIQTLGCKVNQYESEQIATLLRRRGLVQVQSAHAADLRVVNTCSVTVQAESKSRQTVRRATRLTVLEPSREPGGAPPGHANETPAPGTGRLSLPAPGRLPSPLEHHHPTSFDDPARPRIIVTGCWATSDEAAVRRLPGVDAVLGHHDDVAAELNRLLDSWDPAHVEPIQADRPTFTTTQQNEPLTPKPFGDEGTIREAGASAAKLWNDNKPPPAEPVKQKTAASPAPVGMRALPLLDSHQTTHQRALLKIQDGCDAHCTYCIIPQLRPALWSKPIDDAVDEAQRLVDSGHVEIVLTGIFLGAYGQPTALRRRQPHDTAKPLRELVDALCTRVRGLGRLRFSSLEPGDLTRDLLDAMRAHPQCVPHFHLPLQSGSDALLRRMNRQYTRDDFCHMIDDVHAAFDRPAITTDIITGFPGETDAEFARTLEVVDRVRFIHIHAFSYSPRPNTAAARWTSDFVRGPVVNQRIDLLNDRARQHSYIFRQQFLGETVELLVERSPSPGTPGEGRGEGSVRHGRCERYFDVHFEDDSPKTGELIRVRIDRITPARTTGTRVDSAEVAR